MLNQHTAPEKTLKDTLTLSPIEKYIIYGITSPWNSYANYNRYFSMEDDTAYSLDSIHNLAVHDTSQLSQYKS